MMNLNLEAEAWSFIEKAQWQLAKTMPKYPHEYTVRKWNMETEFEDFIRYINSFGTLQKKYSWRLVYLDMGDWYYWTMGGPLEDIGVINRSRHEWEQRANRA